MEIKVALAGVLVVCTILTGAACGGLSGENSSGASRETPGDESARAGEKARSANDGAATSAMEPTEPSASGVEATRAEKQEHERGEAAGAGGRTRGKRREVEERRRPEASEEAVMVEIEGLVYEPSLVEVPVGATAQWVNEDRAEHTVTSEAEGGPLRSEAFGEGGAFAHTFERPGEFRYFCEVHPFMKGIVVVR